MIMQNVMKWFVITWKNNFQLEYKWPNNWGKSLDRDLFSHNIAPFGMPMKVAKIT